MRYAVAIGAVDADGKASRTYLPDALTTFDYPVDAKAHLLALVADELALASATTCTWLGDDTVEVFQPTRKAPDQRRRFMIVPVDDEDE